MKEEYQRPEIIHINTSSAVIKLLNVWNNEQLTTNIHSFKKQGNVIFVKLNHSHCIIGEIIYISNDKKHVFIANDNIRPQTEADASHQEILNFCEMLDVISKCVPGIYPPMDSASSGMADCNYPSLPPFKRGIKDYD